MMMMMMRKGLGKAATNLLEATVGDRRRLDHQSHTARIIGLYYYYYNDNNNNNSEATNWLIAVQPDRSCGRKLIFLEVPSGEML
jgi:hypothetical protein